MVAGVELDVSGCFDVLKILKWPQFQPKLGAVSLLGQKLMILFE